MQQGNEHLPGVEAGEGIVLSVASPCRRLVEWPGPAVALVHQVPRYMPMGMFPEGHFLASISCVMVFHIRFFDNKIRQFVQVQLLQICRDLL